jgi:phosphoribosyl-ATP pyrophosphohydrolase/phosphoribosyl-AMP cyclohydrolase
MKNLLYILKFDEKGLIPVVVQDFYNNEVLMVAYANKEAIEKTLDTGYAHYFSRSRQELWFKGQTSGHTQKVKQILYDCDEDTLLIKVEQKGAACHTNHRSCFYREFYRGTTKEIQDVIENGFNGIIYNEKTAEDNILNKLYNLLITRKKEMPENSYTSKLFKKGINKITKKIGEEATEVVIAMKDADESEIIYEAADAIFHILVGLAYFNIPPSSIMRELERRFNTSGEYEKKTRK